MSGRPAGGTRPSYKSDTISEVLRTYDRTPFMDVLAHWLKAMPNEEELAVFAKRVPHLYVNALSTIAKMAGFTDRAEHVHRHEFDFTKMSDVEIEQRMLEVTKRLQLPSPSEGGDIEMAPTEAEAIIDLEVN